jgi:long-chain-fatty-acid--CoA ligase ACSBG
MGQKATVYDKPPTFDDGSDTFSSYEKKPKGGWASTDKFTVREILYAKSGMASKAKIPGQTIHGVFSGCAERAGDKPALRWEDPKETAIRDDGSVPDPTGRETWNSFTWKEYYDCCRTAAQAFIALGMEPMDGVTIFGFNSRQWFVSEVAAIFAGGVAAGIYPSDTPAQFRFKLEHSGSSMLMMESAKHLKDNFDTIVNGKKVKAVVVWSATEDELEDYQKSNVKVLTWEQFLKVGSDANNSKALDERIFTQKPGSVCAYIYTSGTTGNPKAVMITHDNIIYESTCALLHLQEHQGVGRDACEERILSYLPLSHVAGMMVDIVMPAVATNLGPAWMIAHFARAYDLKKGTIGGRLTTVQPTMFLGVPRVWEKVAEKVKKIGLTITGVKKSISTWGKGVGLEHQNNTQMGGSGEYPWFYTLANGIVGKGVAKKLGLDECKFGFTGAAPISKDTLQYFGSLGLNVNEVYGMSECTGAVTFSCDAAHVWGSCGYALPGCEIKILHEDGSEAPLAKDMFNPTEDEQGEICYRGRNIMAGYMANPALGKAHLAEIQKKVEDAIDADGWLHSGDKGCLNTKKMLKITGRYKELIIGAGGENIAPVPIEDEIKRLVPGVKNFMMVGDKRKFNVAFATLKAEGANDEKPGTDNLDAEALELASDGVTTVSGAMDDQKVIDAITNAIKATNKNGAVVPHNAAKIQKFTILPHDFSIETGELTPTFKTKRSVIQNKHKHMVEKIYNSKEVYVKYA